MPEKSEIILYNLIVLALYFTTAQLGLMLAIPPGFASAIWPAAGIALALTLVWSPKVLPGILFGSMLANLTVVDSYSINAFAFAFLLGVGASLQALFGYYLLAKQIISEQWLLSISRIRRFLLKAGPLSCLVSASVGSLSLLSFSYINKQDVIFTWVTWWVGDMLGTLFVAPICLVIAYRYKLRLRHKIFQVIAPSIMVFSLVIIVFAFNRAEQNRVARQHLLQDSLRVAQALEYEISRYKAYARTYSAFFASSHKIEEEEFIKFSSIVVQPDDSLFATSWVPKIPRTEKQAYLDAMLKENSSFSIKTIDYSLLPDFYPITYIYPEHLKSNALGLDIGSEQLRATALVRAEKLNKPTITEPLTLFQSKQNKPAFLIFSPVIVTNTFATELAESHIVLVIESETLLQNVLAKNLLANRSFNYSVNLTTNDGIVLFEKNKNVNTDIVSTHTIKVMDQHWLLNISASSSEIIAKKDWSSWLILVVGVVLTIMLQTFILWLTSSHNSIARQVKIKTKELNRAKLKAEQATVQKTYFLANMSHELRTPLNAILGIAEMLSKSNLDNQQTELLNKQKVASKTLLSLISDILDVSKIETGKIELEIAPFSIRKLMLKSQNMFESQAELKGLTFKVNYKGNGSDWLLGDEHRLQQVVSNLCSNALKFTESGGVTLSIRNEKDIENEQQNLLIFEVIDTGIGIEDTRVLHIFDSFTQADSSVTRKYGGSGLGLAISKTLIELMKGSIFCESQIGLGTKFTCQLTLKNAVSEENKQVQTLRNAEQQLKNILEGALVLIAEDNEINQQIIAFHIESLGADITLANNGLEAVKAVENCSFDLILMDIQMPEMDGLQATKLISQMPNGIDVPVVAMTANVSVEDKQACFAVGMRAHIPKPFEVNKLHHTLLQILSSPKINHTYLDTTS
ncbi:ATP-binding protein [Catenovulum sediminis]|uniref:histidine kinase n=1 Tax=Catenovulum sediminis TaxID=1740262 RepID=A0ABV1RMX0_9ALTE